MVTALDLFCGAGGASMGLHRAGFDVTGVDIKPQKRYPFNFIQGDALTVLELLGDGFDFIWASPPCQRFSTMTKRWGREDDHPDLIEKTRELLVRTGKPYVIENVPGAPLISPTVLCGSMFGLRLRRHRSFETSFDVGDVPPHDHSGPVVGVYGNPGGSSKRDGIKFGGVSEWKSAMDIDWMVASELAEAIPPAYSYFLARKFLDKKETIRVVSESNRSQ